MSYIYVNIQGGTEQMSVSLFHFDSMKGIQVYLTIQACRVAPDRWMSVMTSASHIPDHGVIPDAWEERGMRHWEHGVISNTGILAAPGSVNCYKPIIGKYLLKLMDETKVKEDIRTHAFFDEVLDECLSNK